MPPIFSHFFNRRYPSTTNNARDDPLENNSKIHIRIYHTTNSSFKKRFLSAFPKEHVMQVFSFWDRWYPQSERPFIERESLGRWVDRVTKNPSKTWPCLKPRHCLAQLVPDTKGALFDPCVFVQPFFPLNRIETFSSSFAHTFTNSRLRFNIISRKTLNKTSPCLVKPRWYMLDQIFWLKAKNKKTSSRFQTILPAKLLSCRKTRLSLPFMTSAVTKAGTIWKIRKGSCLSLFQPHQQETSSKGLLVELFSFPKGRRAPYQKDPVGYRMLGFAATCEA